MTALDQRRRSRRDQDLLHAYSEALGGALRRRSSTVALRAAKVEAELAYKARAEFLASMNHELRTPLNAISGFAGLLKHSAPGSFSKEQMDQYLDYILDSADLLLSHINTLIEVADAESGGIKLRRRAIVLSEIIDRALQSLAEKDDVAPNVKQDVPGGLPLVDVDAEKMAIALGHLIGFISALSEEQPIVKLSARAGLQGKSANFVYVSLECRDVHVPSAERQEAFRVFERVQEGLYRRFDAKRLGLPIAKSFIELNGGKFNVKSTPGEGTFIRFALPIARSEAKAAPEQARRETPIAS